MRNEKLDGIWRKELNGSDQERLEEAERHHYASVDPRPPIDDLELVNTLAWRLDHEEKQNDELRRVARRYRDAFDVIRELMTTRS